MRIFPFKRKEIFSEEEKNRLVQAIRVAERLTSGEIRLFVESHCSYVNPMDRAKEAFLSLGMEKTKQRNGVLVYVAIKDRQFAILGDQGIHDKVGDDFWIKAAELLRSHFQRTHIVEGIEECIGEIGSSLRTFFPHEADDDVNQLPDDIVFGR
ncbi:TLP18.3/Psb32/MOLO-1 phosphatase superfamily protein [Chitinophaga niastensis]|uniref:TLP18.3/Psb32/MOLO-1 phosphatase superfamily protein n=1 Tax=Chitinophaga niastensis TaxID=536980 RepID=A0A2P8HR66_CHINA|nr:TPM domain-containing protein [Chitinophaga niastensis]PSL48684.1 TLP18.3/Psb32/MOLO-1 phosphatase superfamily protein [Chitinophaga niastensis]